MDRNTNIQRLRNEEFDLCIIGGGASGAGCALDAALRGLKVALVEKTDFAAETSSRSTKLIHGGVRYLEQAFKNLDFARLAQKENIELFCFGTELGNSVAKRPEYWLQLIQKIKKIYSGKLTYAANWDDFDKVPFWNELDYIGIDAYFPLSDAKTPAIADLNKAWQQYILKMEKMQAKTNKKILFTEFGYRNADQAAQEPWAENQNSINNLAQANGYESLFQTLTQKAWFAGGFAWKWYADAYHKEKKNNVDYTPQEKPALETIKKWYK